MGPVTRIEIDGAALDVPEGTSLLAAVRAVGTEMPALCHDDRLSPAASCRTCLVCADGRTVAACVTPATPGVRVETATEDLRTLRREAVEVIVSALPPRVLASDGRSRSCGHRDAMTDWVDMPAEFMDAKATAEYLNMSISWVYRDAPCSGSFRTSSGAAARPRSSSALGTSGTAVGAKDLILVA
ncbi:2Fe-2S iron-sulfur cluster-binding protein [Streptomyces sp. NBC_01618]|uniref:2Fe-2S iron-sulfur cluster-binding protein n=1 Tax=Streptomyces sp. NBC_01618 TaxID=2975900 RepID=UPI00386A5A6C|nr:2Fe-2S iron-sulfur cluster-binding protein [Streptomyces sp. NBC_01618]